MSTYNELKDNFEHLQKQTLELFKVGKKQENHLESTLANVWKKLARISNLDLNMVETKDSLSRILVFIEDALVPQGKPRNH